MSCRHRPDYRTFTSLLTRQVEEFQVATSGGVWAATGAFSSLTRKMPIAIRVLYEFGGFPLAQFVVFAVILSIIRALRYSIGADKSCRLR